MTDSTEGQPAPREIELEVADRVHSAAIRVLRYVRSEDTRSGLSASKLSALSVIVFGGPISMGALAEAEQVRPPTISRLVRELEWQELVTRRRDPADGRVWRLTATAKGKRLLEEGRSRRVERLAGRLAELSPTDLRTLRTAADLLEKIGRRTEPSARAAPHSKEA